MCVNMIAENVFASGVWPLLSNLEDPDLGKIEAKPKVQKKSVIADMLKAMVEPMLVCRIGCLIKRHGRWKSECAKDGQWHAGPTQLLALGSIGVELVVLICIGFPILLTRLTQDGRAVVIGQRPYPTGLATSPSCLLVTADQEDQEQYLDTISNNHIP
ncbi:hypothetical protein EMCRGX_G013218 [Ephydatia muelleri]